MPPPPLCRLCQSTDTKASNVVGMAEDKKADQEICRPKCCDATYHVECIGKKLKQPQSGGQITCSKCKVCGKGGGTSVPPPSRTCSLCKAAIELTDLIPVKVMQTAGLLHRQVLKHLNLKTPPTPTDTSGLTTPNLPLTHVLTRRTTSSSTTITICSVAVSPPEGGGEAKGGVGEVGLDVAAATAKAYTDVLAAAAPPHGKVLSTSTTTTAKRPITNLPSFKTKRPPIPPPPRGGWRGPARASGGRGRGLGVGMVGVGVVGDAPSLLPSPTYQLSVHSAGAGSSVSGGPVLCASNQTDITPGDAKTNGTQQTQTDTLPSTPFNDAAAPPIPAANHHKTTSSIGRKKGKPRKAHRGGQGRRQIFPPHGGAKTLEQGQEGRVVGSNISAKGKGNLAKGLTAVWRQTPPGTQPGETPQAKKPDYAALLHAGGETPVGIGGEAQRNIAASTPFPVVLQGGGIPEEMPPPCLCTEAWVSQLTDE
ncbi:unnamed protein product [Vitrella brassicaformis CCMP3155]|uniref:Zinc finger PHD-type domain-containing protein n=1 Tax=Vitrella brassicaformis (strain CCMP3155) TaxID=1169540 RepID=A0A0G4GJX0_VITBC|nr:unnamed protein product [Vitrella brassicaformis CCMP3155]|eukprot:CEM30203.1 unnamed protein product [Vitrella brassicaformis CCMP3155]